MEARTSVRAGHLTVTGVKLTTLAERETVGLVGAEKLIVSSLNQGNKGLFSGVNQPTVDALQVGDNRKVLQRISAVDRLEPLHLAVADNRVSSEEKNGFLQVQWRQENGGLFNPLEPVHG